MHHFLLTSTLFLLSSVSFLHSMELVKRDQSEVDGTICIRDNKNIFYGLQEEHQKLTDLCGIPSNQIYPLVTVGIHVPNEFGGDKKYPLPLLQQLKTGDIVKLNATGLELTLKCIGNEDKGTSFEQDLEEKVQLFVHSVFSKTINIKKIRTYATPKTFHANGVYERWELFSELIESDIIDRIPTVYPDKRAEYDWGNNAFKNIEHFRAVLARNNLTGECQLEQH